MKILSLIWRSLALMFKGVAFLCSLCILGFLAFYHFFCVRTGLINNKTLNSVVYFTSLPCLFISFYFWWDTAAVFWQIMVFFLKILFLFALFRGFLRISLSKFPFVTRNLIALIFAFSLLNTSANLAQIQQTLENISFFLLKPIMLVIFLGIGGFFIVNNLILYLGKLELQKATPKTTPAVASSSSASLFEQSSNEENICVVCEENLIDCVFKPCGHLVCCHTCADWCAEDKHHECPMCRKRIEGVMKIFRR